MSPFPSFASPGVTLIFSNSNGLIKEVVEYRQPTAEECEQFLMPVPGGHNLEHLIPCEDSMCLVGSADGEDAEVWKLR